MKILILANNDVGLYKFRKELIQELIHPGSVLELRQSNACSVCISLPDGEFIMALKEIGCKFVNTPIDRRGMNPVKDLKLLILYRSILKKIKPDVVLTYTIKPNIYGGILCGLMKIPYISNVTGLGTSIENENFMSKIILILYKLGLYSASTVFFQNKINKQVLEKKKIVKGKGVIIPGSGVNLAEHCFEEYPEEQQIIRFLFVGRIMRNKGIDEYLDCAEHIRKNYPDTVFSIVGAFDEKKYKTRIDELHKQKIIHYYGQQENVHSFIKEHHATVLPSYHEGLSNVLLESAASGRPVLASMVPGCVETFEDGVTGIGFAEKNSQSLIEAVEQFLKLSYEDKKRMGVKAREKIIKEFDRKSVIQFYLDAIDKAL